MLNTKVPNPYKSRNREIAIEQNIFQNYRYLMPSWSEKPFMDTVVHWTCPY